jgi:pyruvate dehydrogenase (quinone)
MAKKNLAELLIDTLVAAGVKRIYGLAGDSLNGITDAIRTDERIKWIHVRHEETAAFAAGAEAHLTGTLAVCAGSCGPGNLHLINGLYDANRSRVPVLALASYIPKPVFPRDSPESIFRECSHYCELISQAEQMPRVVEIAIQTALAKRGVAVVVLPGDVALREATDSTPRLNFPEIHTTIRPSDEEIARTADILQRVAEGHHLWRRRMRGCPRRIDGAGRGNWRHRSCMRSAARNSSSTTIHFDVGMTGLLGFSSGYRAMMECDTLLMLGTDFPYQQFYPEKATIIQVDIRGEQIGRRTKVDLGVVVNGHAMVASSTLDKSWFVAFAGW